MNLFEDSAVSDAFAGGEHVLLSKISRLMESETRSDQLVIAVYLLEQNRFLYINSAFKRLLGNKTQGLFDRGWDFWHSNICSEERPLVKNGIRVFFSYPFDQKRANFRYHMLDADKNMICLKHEIVLHKFAKGTMALNYFFDISEKERIERCLNAQNNNVHYHYKNQENLISPREEEVLKLIADGYSSKQIADQLCISNHTAISHRKHLIEKFRVKNTAHLIKKASSFMQL